jgi:hypothetical protein
MSEKQDSISKLVKSMLENKHSPSKINQDLDYFDEES